MDIKTHLTRIPGIFQKLDELLFNFRSSSGTDYKGTTNIIYLPVLAGVGTAIYVFISSVIMGVSDAVLLGHVKNIVYTVWVLNEIIHIKRAFILPGFLKKFLYPFFVAFVTLVIYAFLFYITFLAINLIFMAIMAAIGIYVIILLIKESFSHQQEITPSVTPSTSSFSSSSSDKPAKTIQTAIIDDGTPFGEKLTKNGSGAWTDTHGNEYEEAWGGDGFKRK